MTLLPIMLGRAPVAVEPWIIQHRKQLWSEALVKFNEGVRAGLSRELQEQAMEHTKRYLKRHDHIEDAVYRLSSEFQFKTTTDLLIESGFISQASEANALHPKTIHYFTDSLIGNGCVPVEIEVDNKKVSGWERQAINKDE